MEIANSGIIADMTFDVVDKKKPIEASVARGEKRIKELIEILK